MGSRLRLAGMTVLLFAPGMDASAEGLSNRWAYSASILGYLVPHDRDFALPVLAADHDRLHLEARYNYEDRDTASLWVGRNWRTGEQIRLDFTAMLGGVFGQTSGAAPGYHATVGWKKIELYSEGEYVLDASGRSSDFFYTWSELSIAPMEWWRFGGVIQKTRAYETNRDVQRGFLIGALYKKVAFTTYVFNPDDAPLVVLGMSTAF